MKKILSLLIIAMLTLNLYACSNTDSTNNSTTRDTSTANAATPYTYEGVTFEFPTVWGEPEGNDDSDNTYYFYPEGQNDKKHDTVPAMLMIDITDADYLTDMSQEEIESNFDEFNSGISDTITITSNKIVSSFKYPCEYVTGTNTTSGESRNIAMYVFFYNKKLYNVMMSTRDDNKHDYSSNLTNIINSLEYSEDSDNSYDELTTEDDYKEVTTEVTEATTAAKKKTKKESYKKENWNPQITYSQLARTPDDYVGNKITFEGKVIQVSESSYSDTVYLRVATSDDYNKVMLIEYDSSILSSRILEDDEIRFYGTSTGLYTYESTWGKSVTIPAATVEHITIQ